MDMNELTAHYGNAPKGKKILIIAKGPSITFENRIAEIEVKGKVEARKIAAERGAKCWNF